MYQLSQMKVALTDSIIKFLKDMTVGLGSDVLGMISNEYKGLLEDPLETLSENVESLLMFKAILFPASKEEFEIQDRVLSGIWENIKADFNSEFTNGNTYTKSRYVYNLVIEIGSLFFGAGELKAAAGVKKADNVIDGVRAIDKVSDVKKLSNGELWFNYFNKAYGAENVEWTSKVFEGNAALRERVFANIEMSRLARESSNYSDFAKFEREFATKGISKVKKVIAKNPLPNLENARINPKKLTEYALNPEHPVGGNKAKVFESTLGYNKSNADDLMNEVYNKLYESDATLGKLDEYGQRYTVDMNITGPNGSSKIVRTGWIIKKGSKIPDLTTIYVK